MNSSLEQQKINSSSPVDQTNLFGTDGIRAQVGTYPCTKKDLKKLGYAIGIWAINKYGSLPHILLGHDTRESASFMISSLAKGLLQHPIALCNAGILPTPAIIKVAQSDPSIDCALIITASHNPYQDNGIKIIDKKNGKLSTEDEETISRLFHESSTTSHATLGNMYRYQNAQETYIQLIQEYFPSCFLSGKKIIIDCANGAISSIAQALFNHSGAKIILMNNHPNGHNINQACGAIYPQQLQQAVVSQKADLGFAFDGDGDRLIAVNNKGSIKNGDDILALLMNHPAYSSSSTLVCTIMSNGGLEKYVQEKGKKIVRTPVGDKYVSAKLKEESLMIGGEQSGHILLADFLYSSDAAFTALRICETVKLTQNWELASFEHIGQVLINLPIREKRNLEEPDIANVISYYRAKLHDGRIVVRYSGTENILRIMLQHANEYQATELGNELAQKLKEII